MLLKYTITNVNLEGKQCILCPHTTVYHVSIYTQGDLTSKGQQVIEKGSDYSYGENFINDRAKCLQGKKETSSITLDKTITPSVKM